jgi:YbbR domain-containing protein
VNSLVVRLLDHWQLKLLSLVFAVVLWIFVAAEDQGEAVLRVPLTLTDVPPGVKVTSPGAESVEVRIQGFRHLLDRLDVRGVRAEVSLGGARPGDVVVTVRPENVVLPRGLQVVRIRPSEVPVTLMPVVPVTPATPGAGKGG